VCDICVNNNNNIRERVEKVSNFNLGLTKFAGQGTQYCNVGDEVYVYNLVEKVGLYHQSGGTLNDLQVCCFDVFLIG